MDAEPIVSLAGLTRYFGATPAVHDVSLTVPAGQVVALLGPNGAGKSTLIRMLLGLLEPTRGTSRLLGCDSGVLIPEIRARIGYLAEGHHLYGWMRIRELAEFTRRTHPRWDGGHFAAFLDYFRLAPDLVIGRLSNGQRACVALATTLACRPELLILDDPTLGVDAELRRDFLRGIVDLAGDADRTVVFSSHILADVERVADRLVILMEGAVRVDVSPDAFKEAVARFHVSFAGPVPAPVAVPRAVRQTTTDTQLAITVIRPGADTEAAFSAAGATAWRREPLTLEDAFIDYVTGGPCRRPFPSAKRNAP
jgi:ABC-2 type transport system ATP-binding protein